MVFLQAELVQPVVIERFHASVKRAGAANRRLARPTWHLMEYSVLTRESLTVRGRIGQAVGAFVADYKAANKN